MTTQQARGAPDPQLRVALAHVEREVLAVARGGFGEVRVASTVEKDQRRSITVTSGATRRFVIPVAELPGASVRRDP